MHNIGEERNVGSFNNACTVRGGTRDLTSLSQKVVLKSSVDIFDRCNPSELWKYKDQSHKIESVKTQWNTLTRALQQNGYREKDLLNTRKEEK